MPKIRVGFSFLLFNSLIFMFRENGLILGFYAACLVHEAGHFIAVRMCGGTLERVELSCFGIKMTASPPKRTSHGVFILLSGPAANLMTAAVLSASGKYGYFTVFSLAEGIFNLLPYSFLDGGAALELLAECSENEDIIRKIYFIIRCVVSIILIGILFLCGNR